MLRHMVFWVFICVYFIGNTVFAGAVLDGPNSRITDSGLNSVDDAGKPDVAVLGDSVYVTWMDERYYNDHAVMFSRSDDRGATWSDNVLVSKLPYNDWADNAQIAVQPDGTIWIVWYLFYTADSKKVNDLHIARSTDNGVTWQEYYLKNGEDDGKDLWKTRIAVDSDYVYVLYHEYGHTTDRYGFNIILHRFDSNTLTESVVTVNDLAFSGRESDGLLDYGPQIDLDLRETSEGGVICAAWEDSRDRGSIYSACSTDQGQTFSDNSNVSGGDAINPKIALSPEGRLHVTYSSDIDNKGNVLLRSSDDFGQSWNDVIDVTNLQDSEVFSFDLAVDRSGQIIIPWVEGLGSFGSTGNLNVSTSSNEGNSFALLVDIEDDQGRYPTVSTPNQVSVATGPSAGNDDYLYFAWRDDRNTHEEIWFTRALSDSTPPSQPDDLVATSSDRSIHLTWQPATDAMGVQGYHVYRSETAEGPFVQWSNLLVRTTEFTDVSLDAGALFYYQVAAVDGTGNLGSRSAVASARVEGGSDLPDATLFYEVGGNIHWQALKDGSTQTITEAVEPVLSLDGKKLYYRSSDTIYTRPIESNTKLGTPNTKLGTPNTKLGTPNTKLGTPTSFFTRENIGEFDIAADDQHFSLIALRDLYSTAGGLCYVSEPIFATSSQDFYTEQFDYGSDVSISSDHHWMAYRTTGFCNSLAFGLYDPGYICLVNLSTQERNCFEGLDAAGSDFAPTGSDIVLAAAIGGQYEVWRAQVTNEGDLINFKQITRGTPNQPVANPRWSSDGKWIVFQRDLDTNTDDDATNWHLFAVRADGSVLRDLQIEGSEPAMLVTGESVGDTDVGSGKKDDIDDTKDSRKENDGVGGSGKSGGGGSMSFLVIGLLFLRSLLKLKIKKYK